MDAAACFCDGPRVSAERSLDVAAPPPPGRGPAVRRPRRRRASTRSARSRRCACGFAPSRRARCARTRGRWRQAGERDADRARVGGAPAGASATLHAEAMSACRRGGASGQKRARARSRSETATEARAPPADRRERQAGSCSAARDYAPPARRRRAAQPVAVPVRRNLRRNRRKRRARESVDAPVVGFRRVPRGPAPHGRVPRSDRIHVRAPRDVRGGRERRGRADGARRGRRMDALVLDRDRNGGAAGKRRHWLSFSASAYGGCAAATFEDELRRRIRHCRVILAGRRRDHARVRGQLRRVRGVRGAGGDSARPRRERLRAGASPRGAAPRARAPARAPALGPRAIRGAQQGFAVDRAPGVRHGVARRPRRRRPTTTRPRRAATLTLAEVLAPASVRGRASEARRRLRTFVRGGVLRRAKRHTRVARVDRRSRVDSEGLADPGARVRESGAERADRVACRVGDRRARRGRRARRRGRARRDATASPPPNRDRARGATSTALRGRPRRVDVIAGGDGDTDLTPTPTPTPTPWWSDRPRPRRARRPPGPSPWKKSAAHGPGAAPGGFARPATVCGGAHRARGQSRQQRGLGRKERAAMATRARPSPRSRTPSPTWKAARRAARAAEACILRWAR